MNPEDDDIDEVRREMVKAAKLAAAEEIAKKVAAAAEANYLDQILAKEATVALAKKMAEDEYQEKLWSSITDMAVSLDVMTTVDAKNFVNHARGSGATPEQAVEILNRMVLEKRRKQEAEEQREKEEIQAKIPKPAAYGSWA